MLVEPVVWLQAKQPSDLGDIEPSCRVQGVPWRESGWQRVLIHLIGSATKAGKQRRARVHGPVAVVGELERECGSPQDSRSAAQGPDVQFLAWAQHKCRCSVTTATEY